MLENNSHYSHMSLSTDNGELVLADVPDDCPRVSGTSQHYLVHVVLRVYSAFRRQTDVSVLGCSHLERDRGPAAQRHADVDERSSFHHERTTYDDTHVIIIIISESVVVNGPLTLHLSRSSAAFRLLVRCVSLRTPRSQLLLGLPGFLRKSGTGVLPASSSTDTWGVLCAASAGVPSGRRLAFPKREPVSCHR